MGDWCDQRDNWRPYSARTVSFAQGGLESLFTATFTLAHATAFPSRLSGSEVVSQSLRKAADHQQLRIDPPRLQQSAGAMHGPYHAIGNRHFRITSE